MCRRAAGALGLALATAAHAHEPEEARVVTAVGATAEPARSDDAAPSEAGSAVDGGWRLCQVSLSLLLTSGGRSQVLREESRALFHGEVIELDGEAQAQEGSRLAVLRYQVRLRAAMARPDGVVYHLTSSARLTSTIGFSSELVGRDEVRHAFLDIGDPGARLHEVFAMPDPAVRLVLGLSAAPIVGRAGKPRPAVGPATFENPEVFRIEVVLREGEVDKLIDSVQLTTTSGRPASYAVGRLDARRREAGDPERRLGDGVRAVDLGSLRDTGYAARHALAQRPADRGWHERHVEAPDDDYLEDHEIRLDDEDAPRHSTIRVKTKKLSKRKQEKLRAHQEILEAARMAQRQARTLPSGEDVPGGFLREELSLSVTPLHAGLQFVQAEVRLRGAVRLPGDEDVTPIDLDFVEQLERGEPFELGLVEVLRGGGSKYDYVFRIIPSS
jgi:hypothetical protein